MDSLANFILANPAEALGIVSAFVSLLVWVVSKQKWFKVPERKLRRWGATVFTTVLVGLATEWLAPPFEIGKAAMSIFALLGGSLAIFRMVKWIIEKLKEPE